jgi:hypothetical protein
MKVFTIEEAASINEYQQSGFVHPFTCGGDNHNDAHLDGEGVLVAIEDGLHCPYCDYHQYWAHDFMKDGSWKKIMRLHA